ncbi:phosphoglycerate mutase-like protein [Cyathus striatus]|nr:phosphoglycerate mutase-like protein [Cyathus striatus]
MSNTDSKILGVVLLIRHGDREGFYQDPITYDAANTAITPLGSVQEFQLGQKLRGIYLNESSSSFISTVNSTIAQGPQLMVRADGGVSLLQGLFPATPASSIVLSNGTDVEGPLGGYQYVAIESVEPSNDVSLEGYTSCNTFNNATVAFYNSDAFKLRASQSANFLQQLPPFLDGRPVTLQNMIFDYMNVQSIHNSTFAKNLPPTFLAQARDLANFHEYGVFSSPQLNGIGNIAGQAILPSIINGLHSIANASDPMKFMYEAISYKPFISLFNMTGAAEQQPEIAGVVNYAATVALEVRQPASGGEPIIRMNFMNGTDDSQYRMLNILGTTGDIPLSSFVNQLAPVAINDTATWCSVCANTQDRGCAAIAAARADGIAAAQIHQKISPVGAGFLGAGLTAAVAIIMLVVLLFFGVVNFGKKSAKAHKIGAWGLSCNPSDLFLG